MISRFYNEFVNVNRLAVVLDEDSNPTNKKDFINHLTNVRCNIQAVDQRISKDIANAFGKDLQLFCDVYDIIEGDRIIRGDTEYRIVGVRTYTMSDNPHMIINIRAFKT